MDWFVQSITNINKEYSDIRMRLSATDPMQYAPLTPPLLTRQHAIDIDNSPLIPYEQSIQTVPPIFKYTMIQIIKDILICPTPVSKYRLLFMANAYDTMYGNPENQIINDYIVTFSDIVFSLIIQKHTSQIINYEPGQHTRLNLNTNIYTNKIVNSDTLQNKLINDHLYAFTNIAIDTIKEGSILLRFAPHLCRLSPESVHDIIRRTLPDSPEIGQLYNISVAL